jgi:Domain of unknown function (DUF4932)
MSSAGITTRVRVDLRVEVLMGAVALAAPRLPQQGWIGHPLRRRALRMWSNLHDHAAPRLVRWLLVHGFWVDDLLRMTPALVEEREGVLHSRFASTVDTPVVIGACDEFAESLVSFAEQSHIWSLLEGSENIAGEVLSAIGGCGTVAAWADRCRAILGSGPAQICIFPSPLCGAHLGYGPTIYGPDSAEAEAWTVFGPVWRPHRRPWELVGFQSPKLRRLVRHELGHAHLNWHTAQVASHVAEYESLFEPRLRNAMRSYGYGRWDVCLIEHVLRAFEGCFVREDEGTVAAERYFEREERKGFFLVRAVARALEEIPVPLAGNYPEFLHRLARFVKGENAIASSVASLSAAV